MITCYLLAKFGFDTAENEPKACKVCPLSAYRSLLLLLLQIPQVGAGATSGPSDVRGRGAAQPWTSVATVAMVFFSDIVVNRCRKFFNSMVSHR